MTLARLNDAPRGAFVAALGGIVEHSPWVAEAVAAQRPFASLNALHASMVAVLRDAPVQTQVALFRLHPELAGAEAVAGRLTDASAGEQGRLGLTRLDPAEFARLDKLNRLYRARFGFPCIIALRLHHDLASVFAAFEGRIVASPDAERETALGQIGEVMRGRLAALLGEDRP